MGKQTLKLAVAAMALFAASANAANTVVGSIWENQATAAGNATIANVPVTAPDVTFSAPSTPLSFTSSGVPYTIAGFLSTGGATILTGAAHGGDSLQNTLFDFKGTVSVTNGQTFTAGHDDGMTLVIGGVTVINVPQPTAFVNTTVTYTGPTGNFPFELVYGECCGAPAALAISLPLISTPPVPEPQAYALMLAGLGLVGWVTRRRRQQAG
jgi:hypothetical protein